MQFIEVCLNCLCVMLGAPISRTWWNPTKDIDNAKGKNTFLLNTLCQPPWLTNTDLFFFFFFLSFFGCPTGLWSSWAMDQIQAAVATNTAAMAMPDLLTHCAWLGMEPVSLCGRDTKLIAPQWKFRQTKIFITPFHGLYLPFIPSLSEAAQIRGDRSTVREHGCGHM